MNPQLKQYLLTAAQQEASDLHIVPGAAPTIRRHGELCPIGADALASEETEALLLPTCPQEYRDRLITDRNLDFAFEVADDSGGLHRFRANYFFSGESMGGCFRFIPSRIPDFSWAGFPSDLADRLLALRTGIVLLTGITGSGKTTSLAMLVDAFCRQGSKRVITVEEPVEYVFSSGPHTSIVSQREVGKDVKSFADGLKYGLRQDPDIILVGEIRDRETAQMALSAAETGHLVLSTLHTRDTKGAISRITDLFDTRRQNEIRSQLAFGLRAVICQHLLPSSLAGGKRELALEVLINNTPVSAAIRFGKLESIDTNIQTGGQFGMVSLDESIRRLLADGAISRDTAAQFVSDPLLLR